MNDLRAQLAPGWSGVNIAITVVLFLIAWPLGLLMIAYILQGERLGLDFARPETLTAFGGRLKHAWRAGSATWSSAAPLSSGTPTGAARAQAASGRPAPAGGTPVDAGDELRVERENLERERREFEAEKREWRERHGDAERGGRAHETLDS